MSAAKNTPSQARLHDLFDYDQAGYLTWRVRQGRQSAGGRAGSRQPDGYTVVGVDGERHLLHRLIFAWHRGWCPSLVDHEDRDRGNCRIGNLRDGTHGVNYANSTAPKGPPTRDAVGKFRRK